MTWPRVHLNDWCPYWNVAVPQDGLQGPRGSLWYAGIGAPGTITSAQANDLYCDTSTGDVYQSTGASWVLAGNIRGPQGVPGVGFGTLVDSYRDTAQTTSNATIDVRVVSVPANSVYTVVCIFSAALSDYSSALSGQMIAGAARASASVYESGSPNITVVGLIGSASPAFAVDTTAQTAKVQAVGATNKNINWFMWTLVYRTS